MATADEWAGPPGQLVRLGFDDRKKLDAALKRAPREMKKELRKSHKDTAQQAAGWVKAGAEAGTPQQRHMARSIKGSSTSTQARLEIKPSNTKSRKLNTMGAFGTFYGSKQYPQFPKWVGNDWDMTKPGQGPYVFRSVIPRRLPQIEQKFLDDQVNAIVRSLH